MSMRTASVFAFAAIVVFFPAALTAGELAKPTGQPVLTVSGLIANHNVGDTAQFDMEMLKGLAAEKIVTSTMWTDGKHEFTGVPLGAILDAVKAEGGTLRASALNDYTVDVPASDARPEGGPIIAYEMDGAPMSVRDKGPLWIIYPYDSNADYRSEVIFTRSIWQLDRIEVDK